MDRRRRHPRPYRAAVAAARASSAGITPVAARVVRNSAARPRPRIRRSFTSAKVYGYRLRLHACLLYVLFDLVQWLDSHLAAALCIIRFRGALICAVRLQIEEKKRRATQKKQREEAARRQEEEERKARAAAEAARATGRCSTCHTTYLECCLACIVCLCI
jgi:hypothetical protein